MKRRYLFNVVWEAVIQKAKNYFEAHSNTFRIALKYFKLKTLYKLKKRKLVEINFFVNSTIYNKV